MRAGVTGEYDNETLTTVGTSHMATLETIRAARAPAEFASKSCANTLARRAPSRKLTICHPIWRLARGGLENQLLTALRVLPQDEFAHIVAIQDAAFHDDIEPARQENIVYLAHAASKSDRHWSATLAESLRRCAVDVLHVRGLSMLLDCIMAADAADRVRVAFSFHGFESWPPQISAMRRGILRAAVRRCDDRWAVSPSAAQAIAQVLGMSVDEFGIVPNGVDAQYFMPATSRETVRRKLGLPEEGLLLLTVGNLKPIKGHVDLLHALALLMNSSSVTAAFVGQDHSNGRLATTASTLGVDSRCLFAGLQADVLPWYQAADAFVLPSQWEGMSNALLEAMSCGLPVLATAVGGNVDVIQDGVTGILVPTRDPKRLARALDRMIIDKCERDRFGAAARHQVVQHHDLNRCAEVLSHRYRSIATPIRKGTR